MNNNFDEKYIIELVKKELSKYLTEQGIEMKKQISFLGDDKDIEEKLSQKFEISENAGTEEIDKLLNKTLINTKYKRNYTNDTVQTIVNTYPTAKAICEIQYLPQDNINIDELYTFLDTVYHEIPDIFSAPIISTAFKRLIRFYDWLKFGRS